MNEMLTKEELQQEAAEQQTSFENDLIFYSTKDIARMLHCTPPTARTVMMRQDFPVIMVGKNMKVEKNAFREWAAQRRV